MNQLNHTQTDTSDAVVAAYIHEISARHASASAGPARRGDRPGRTRRRFDAHSTSRSTSGLEERVRRVQTSLR